MKLEVNQDVCIGCGGCQAICPEVFEIGDEGYAQVYVENIDEDLEESATDAKEGCPVNAISEVKDTDEDNKEE